MIPLREVETRKKCVRIIMLINSDTEHTLTHIFVKVISHPLTLSFFFLYKIYDS